MSDQTRLAGQSLLNSELFNGLAAKDAENHALRMAQIHRSGNSNGKVDSLEKENIRLKAQSSSDSAAIHRLLDQVDKADQALATALAEKDALILEWMHSNEAFKRLAKSYGKKLGVSDEQQVTDYREEVVDVSEENPKFAKSDLTVRVKKNLAANP